MSTSLNILVIEDSPVQRAVIGNIVKELGHRPYLIESFHNTITPLIHKDNIDIVLLDLMLHDEEGNTIADGFQVCSELKSSKPDLKIIIISAESDTSAKDFALMQGADAYITKPFKVTDLSDCIKSLEN
jgi:DNA-binding response OmpR family regulator